MAFLYMIALRNKTVAHTFLPSFENANYGHGNVTSHFFLSMTGHEILSFQIFCHSLAYIICA